jgi:hypothetical protein
MNQLRVPKTPSTLLNDELSLAQMRFWPKFVFPWGAIPFVLIGCQTLYTHRKHPDFLFALYAVFLLILPLLAIAVHRTTYWEMNSQHLLDHNFWRERKIRWSEVTEVRWTGLSSRTLCVSIGRRSVDYKWRYFTPKDKAGFIAAFREFAPHAKFDLDPALGSLSLQSE